MTTDPATPPLAASSDERGAGYRRLALRVLRWAFTLGAFAYIASIVELEDLKDAALRVSPWAFAASIGVSSANLIVGSIRWRLLLSAYGASDPPPFLRLVHAYWVGYFYNTWVPGGLGGDVVRGVVIRKAFKEGGAAASVTVVLVERVLGLSGLLALVTGTYLLWPIGDGENVVAYCVIGLTISAAALCAISIGRRLAPWLPSRLGDFARKLPSIERPLPFGLAASISLVTQALASITGFFMLHGIHEAVSLTDAFVVVPIAMASAFFPLSVGGAGVREAAMIVLCTSALAMTRADATAASLLIWATQLFVASFGGLMQFVWPLESSPAEVSEAAPT